MRKNNKKSLGEALIILGVFLIVMAIVLSYFGLKKPAELKEVAKISAEEMTDDYAYHFDELTVLDYYMKQSGGDSGNGRYYIASFYDKGVYYLVSIYGENNDELRLKLKDYADDDEAYIGDLVISGCFTAKKVSAVDGLSEFYDDTAKNYVDLYAEYMNVDAVDLQLHLNYVCEDAADYDDAASTTEALYGGIAFLLIGALVVCLGIRQRKKAMAEIAAREAFNRNQPQEDNWNQF